VSSPDFRIERVSVAGNRLLTTSEIESAADANALNLFWVQRDELNQRLQQLPPVETAWISLELPDHLTIQVKEREPVAIWLAAATPFLVDSEGLVLSSRPSETPLLVVRDPTDSPVAPGERVQADAVRNVASLDAMLASSLGPQPRQYEFLPTTGLNVVQSKGPRLVLGSDDNLQPKITTVQLITRQLESERKTAALIDVRFREHPYYR
jgi:cell division septal protein FtsQ